MECGLGKNIVRDEDVELNLGSVPEAEDNLELGPLPHVPLAANHFGAYLLSHLPSSVVNIVIASHHFVDGPDTPKFPARQCLYQHWPL